MDEQEATEFAARQAELMSGAPPADDPPTKGAAVNPVAREFDDLTKAVRKEDRISGQLALDNSEGRHLSMVGGGKVGTGGDRSIYDPTLERPSKKKRSVHSGAEPSSQHVVQSSRPTTRSPERGSRRDSRRDSRRSRSTSRRRRSRSGRPDRSRSRRRDSRRDSRRSRSTSRRRRSRSGRPDRSRSRRRDSRRDRRERRSRVSSEERSRSGSHERSGSEHKDEPNHEAAGFNFSAVQVVDRLCEVFASRSSKRSEETLELFSNDLRVSRLNSGALICKGISKLKKSIAENASSGRYEASKRVFIESEEQGDPTLCLDMYQEGSSPGWGPTGLSSSGEPTLVLYRVANNKINHVWVTDDEDRLAANPKTTKAGMQASDVWEFVVQIVKASLNGVPICHFSNYSVTEDTLGAGIGSSTKTDTFRLE